MAEPNHPAFDSEEQAILSAIVPEDEPVPTDGTGEPAPAEAPKPAEPTPAPTEAPAAPTPEAPVAKPEAAAPAAPGTETQQPAQPQGDPRAALRAARQAEKRLRSENERLQQELEALRQGKAPVDTRITEDELAELERDFPLQAKVVRRQRELEEQLAATARAQTPPQPEFQPVVYDPAVQEVIDSVPDLLAWQYDPNAQDKFQRAIQYDAALSVDPDWRGRPAHERFEEAARRTKDALAPAAAPSPSTPAAPAAPRLDPAQAIASAPVEGPKGISDFRGGAPASAPALDYSRMSDEAVMASLKPDA